MTRFEHFQEQDILEHIVPLLIQKGWRMGGDGKLHNPTWSVIWDSPWVHSRLDQERNCVFCNIVFEYLAHIPTRCLRCYKVVARPRTVAQLFELEDIQQEMGEYSKCGIEIRPTVFGNYGGYWYTDSIEEGRERYRQVREALDQAFGPGEVPVLLKRGCTEYEIGPDAIGPSDTWQVSSAQAALENKLAELLVFDFDKDGQPEVVKARTRVKWLKHAWSVGDETVREYTGGASL